MAACGGSATGEPARTLHQHAARFRRAVRSGRAGRRPAAGHACRRSPAVARRGRPGSRRGAVPGCLPLAATADARRVRRADACPQDARHLADARSASSRRAARPGLLRHQHLDSTAVAARPYPTHSRRRAAGNVRPGDRLSAGQWRAVVDLAGGSLPAGQGLRLPVHRQLARLVARRPSRLGNAGDRPRGRAACLWRAGGDRPTRIPGVLPAARQRASHGSACQRSSRSSSSRRRLPGSAHSAPCSCSPATWCSGVGGCSSWAQPCRWAPSSSRGGGRSPASAQGWLAGFARSFERERPRSSTRRWLPVGVAAGAVVLVFLPSLLGLVQFTAGENGPGGADEVRSALYRTSLLIGRDYFPLGAGFGRFGSTVTKTEYSPVYYDYGLDAIRGLRPDDPAAASDTFWPRILGETGVFGLLALLVFTALLTLQLWRAAAARAVHAAARRRVPARSLDGLRAWPRRDARQLALRFADTRVSAARQCRHRAGARPSGAVKYALWMMPVGRAAAASSGGCVGSLRRTGQAACPPLARGDQVAIGPAGDAVWSVRLSRSGRGRPWRRSHLRIMYP